jgi:hypothetical protein
MININNNTTLIILDWDDTLFPTTWINKNNIEIMNKKYTEIIYQRFFKNLDIALEKLFRLLIKCGKVLIITNALLNWIDISSKIIPLTNNLLQNTNSIKIVSARGEYSSNSSDPMEWKRMAFKNELEKINKNIKINNIISIGDAEYEYNALIKLYSDDIDNFRLLKAIKFIKYPNINQLIDQVNVLYNAISRICKEPSHLDLQLSIIST